MDKGCNTVRLDQGVKSRNFGERTLEGFHKWRKERATGGTRWLSRNLSVNLNSVLEKFIKTDARVGGGMKELVTVVPQ